MVEPDPRIHEVAFLVALPTHVAGAAIVRVGGYRPASHGYASAIVLLRWHQHPVAFNKEQWSTNVLVYRPDNDERDRWMIHRPRYFDDYGDAMGEFGARIRDVGRY